MPSAAILNLKERKWYEKCSFFTLRIAYKQIVDLFIFSRVTASKSRKLC